MFGLAYRRYALVMMTAVYTLNIVDRGLMMLMLEPIKQDLNLSDTQLGLLTGIAFALFYATLGVPIARWADRGNRVNIAACSIALWAGTVMACLFVTTYVQLLIARAAAAVGEAGGKPPTYSLVGDYFPGPAERVRAMSIYWLSSPLAGVASFVVGGWMYARYGWRMTFFLAGLPGLVVAILVKLTIKEPREYMQPTRVQQPLPPMKEVLITLWRQRSCRHLSLALILLYTMGLGLSPWYAAFMMRSHGMSTVAVGVWFGMVVFGLGGTAGVLLGGHLCSRWFTNNERGQMRMTAVMVTLMVPCFVAFLMAPQKHAALLALTLLWAAFNFFLAPTYALMQRLVANEIRATAMAAVMLLANLIGMGIGPQIVGILSDLLFPILGNDSLRYSMLLMSLVALWAAFHFWCVGRSVEKDLAMVAPPIPAVGFVALAQGTSR
jgi:predicted MFS family arabinose efflux permease